jgi:hypothetical protein
MRSIIRHLLAPRYIGDDSSLNGQHAGAGRFGSRKPWGSVEFVAVRCINEPVPRDVCNVGPCSIDQLNIEVKRNNSGVIDEWVVEVCPSTVIAVPAKEVSAEREVGRRSRGRASIRRRTHKVRSGYLSTNSRSTNCV